MLALVVFLHLALPVLSSGATGTIGGYRMADMGVVRSALIRIVMALIGIAANIGYGFLWDSYFEWKYPSVVLLSETRRVFYNYGNQQQERETAFMAGPVIVAGLLVAGSWTACWWWNKRQSALPPTRNL